MIGTRRIVVGQPIHQTHLRSARQDPRHVHYRHAFDAFQWNDLERHDRLRDIRRQVRLDRANHDILTALAPAPAFIEHPEALADARSVTEKNLQSRSRLILLVDLHVAAVAAPESAFVH